MLLQGEKIDEKKGDGLMEEFDQFVLYNNILKHKTDMELDTNTCQPSAMIPDKVNLCVFIAFASGK